jgi:ribosomal protein S18 acetylase RimI-like enzyme
VSKARVTTRARTKRRRKTVRRAERVAPLVAPVIDGLIQAAHTAAGTGGKFPEGKAVVALGQPVAGQAKPARPLEAAGHTLEWRGPRADLSTCPVAVRACTPSDGPAVAALWSELSRIHARFGEEWAISEGAPERYARTVAAGAGNPRLIYLVAEMEIGGAWRVAGFLHAAVKLRSSLYRESVVGEIPAVCVAPDACGRGVGSALVVAAMEWFRTRGITHVETVVAQGNASGLAFWRASGFKDSASVLWAEIPPGVSRPEGA